MTEPLHRDRRSEPPDHEGAEPSADGPTVSPPARPSVLAVPGRLDPDDGRPGTGLPGPLRAQLERRTGFDLGGVRVNRNSSLPGRIGAAAYTRGDEIHLAPGQESEIPHEAWHVVQQRQGRVRATGGIDGQPVAADHGLELEADREGGAAARASGGAGYARAATAPAMSVAASPVPAGAAPIQGRWLILAGKAAGFYAGITWQDGPGDGPDARQEEEPPTVWNDQVEVDCPRNVLVDDGQSRMPRRSGRPIAYTIETYSAQNRTNTRRGGGEHYNPFGRFSTATALAFLPAGGLHGAAAFDKTVRQYAPQSVAITALGQELAWPGGPPKTVVTAKGPLVLASVSALGAVYADESSVPAAARAQVVATADTGALRGFAPAVAAVTGLDPQPEQPMFVKVVRSPAISPTTIATWEGKKRSVSQLQVMGRSAGEIAEHAGYAKAGGRGWEWLHLIAHSMGGAAGTGPQHPDNLVAGTSECNTQMIVVEEALKHIVGRYKLRATLVAHATLVDPVRHIASRIHYDFHFTDSDGKGAQVFHWTFDPLTRANPLSGENVFVRLAMRHHLGDGKDFLGPSEAGKFSGPDSNSMVEAPRSAQARPGDLMPVDELNTKIPQLEQELALHGLDWAEASPKGVGLPEALWSALMAADLGHPEVLELLKQSQARSISGSDDLLRQVAQILHRTGTLAPQDDLVLRGYQMSRAGTVDGVAEQSQSIVIDHSPMDDTDGEAMDVVADAGSEIDLDVLILAGGMFVALTSVA